MAIGMLELLPCGIPVQRLVPLCRSWWCLPRCMYVFHFVVPSANAIAFCRVGYPSGSFGSCLPSRRWPCLVFLLIGFACIGVGQGINHTARESIELIGIVKNRLAATMAWLRCLSKKSSIETAVSPPIDIREQRSHVRTCANVP
jgi:hypothetical protein